MSASRIAASAVLALFIWLAWSEHHKPDRIAANPAEPEQPSPPHGGYRNAAVEFTWIVLAAVTGGVMVLRWIIPAIGERVADVFYSPPESAEETPTHRAIALMSRGEHQKALLAFRKILTENPQDSLAVTELARLYADRLEDPPMAMEVLGEALRREWPEEEHSFLLLRMGDICTSCSRFESAREALGQLLTRYGQGRHAAAAAQKLRQLDEMEFFARRRPIS